MTREEIETKYIGKHVRYANGDYEVVGLVDLFGCLFVQIYDEPPSKHIDMVKLSSVELLENYANTTN